MVVQHADGPSLVDVLDRVLDKGIVIDAWTHVSLVGIDMITIESRVMVASFDTYLNYSEPLRHLPSIALPVGTMGTFYDGTASRSALANDEDEKAPSNSRSPRPSRRQRRK